MTPRPSGRGGDLGVVGVVGLALAAAAAAFLPPVAAAEPDVRATAPTAPPAPRGAWERLDEIAGRSTVVLTTTGRKSGEPREVTIWFVVEDGRVYVQAGENGGTHWYRNLRAHPEVTLDFGELELRGRATPVDAAARTAHVHELFRRKYWLARASSWIGAGFGEGAVVEIAPPGEG